MPVMPSGRFVAIMPERARYHAARLGVRVSVRTPHHQLYPLVDILIEREGGGGGNRGYGFSGYTLADLKWIAQWPESDRRFFLDWIREPAQVGTIERARRRLLAESGPPQVHYYPYPERLYSVLRRRVETLSLRRAPVAQWRRTLNNLVSDGLRRDELTWSGVLDFLAAQPRTAVLEREAVLGAMEIESVRPQLGHELECDRRCTLPFKEVAHRLAAYQLRLSGLPAGDEDIGVVRFHSDEPAYRVGMIRHRRPAAMGPQRWFVLGPYGQPVASSDASGSALFSSAHRALAAANDHALRSHRLRCSLTERALYEYMTLHGGEGYREWLVTLPDYHRSHFNGHFYERNIVVHIRTKERRTSDGERVLFIEEIQSDWHRAAARHGLRGGIPMAPFRREWASLALKLMLLHVVETGLDGIAWADAAVHELRYDRPMPPLQRLYDDEVPRVLRRLARPWHGEVVEGSFETRHPWLHAARDKHRWKVEGGAGRFATRARYDKQEAQRLIERHSKAVRLELPMLLLPEGMRRHIAEHGLPLFGERHTGA